MDGTRGRRATLLLRGDVLVTSSTGRRRTYCDCRFLYPLGGRPMRRVQGASCDVPSHTAAGRLDELLADAPRPWASEVASAAAALGGTGAGGAPVYT